MIDVGAAAGIVVLFFAALVAFVGVAAMCYAVGAAAWAAVELALRAARAAADPLADIARRLR